MEVLEQSTDRPVCDVQESSSPPLLLSSPGPSGMGDGCQAPGLVRPRCISSIRHDERGAKQVLLSSQCLDDSGGSFLADEGMVPRSALSSGGFSKTAPSKSFSSQATPLPQVPLRVVRSGTNRLQTVWSLVRAKGFSRAAAVAIGRCRHQSSSNLCQSKWTVFWNWRRRHNVSSEASISHIADFLLFLRSSKKLSSSTIKRYRSMLSTVFKHRGLDLSSNQDLSDLIKSFSTTRQRISECVSWNLDIVLKWLSGPAFEPLCSISLGNLTRKILFLVALATAKLVSKIQAMDTRVGFTQGETVCSCLGFLAKNEDPSKPWPRSFSIKSLADILGLEEEERLLCPVRAVRYYLQRTEKIRGPSSHLWCSVQNPSRPMSKNAIYFLRDLISKAHSLMQEDMLPSFKVKAHEV